jgi:hypothetical protein
MGQLSEIASGMVRNAGQGDSFEGAGMDIGDLQHMVAEDEESGDDASDDKSVAPSSAADKGVSPGKPKPPGKDGDDFCAWDQLISSAKRSLSTSITKLTESVNETLIAGSQHFDELLHLSQDADSRILFLISRSEPTLAWCMLSGW